jgi:hypothetical protein
MADFQLPPGLPKMSRREERALKQRPREQIKPKSVALVDHAKSFYTAVGRDFPLVTYEERLIEVAAKLRRTSHAKAGLPGAVASQVD